MCIFIQYNKISLLYSYCAIYTGNLTDFNIKIEEKDIESIQLKIKKITLKKNK